MVPIRQCPASVSCASCVLPSRPSPRSGLSPPPSPRREKTPHPHAVAVRLHLPAGQELMGLPKCCDASLPACHGLRTPADLPRLAIPGGRVVPAGAFKPSASATSLFDAVPALRHGRKTRYGWGATPYPTGTFTLQETPSFSWRENAGPQPRLKAAAERTLEGVACTPWFK